MKKTMKEKSLEKYDKMIEWADHQPKRQRPDDDMMYKKIERSWFANDCVYCQKYPIFSGCRGCPLRKQYEIYDLDVSSIICCGGLWVKMSVSKTWGTWVKRARKVRAYIEEHG